MTPPHTYSAVADDALGDMDLTDLVAALRRREVGADEVCAAALSRARAAQGPLNAVVEWTGFTDNAEGGPFSGVPSFLKDNEELAGFPTRLGSRATPEAPSPVSSVFAGQFLDLGFRVLGKTAMPEFGLTATTEPLAGGPTRNPWNLDHSVGGSSGGSAALVAAGVVPLAHANDGGGSIRIPAACTGLVGLKPSRGRVVLPERMRALPIKITAQGALTRTVRDTALFYSELDKFQRVLPPLGLVEGPDAKRLRIGVFTNSAEGLPVDRDVVAATETAAATCADLGHVVDLIPSPFSQAFGRDFLRYWGWLALAIDKGGKAGFGEGFDPSLLEPMTLGLSAFGSRLLGRAPTTIRRLRQFAAEYAKLFDTFDVLMSPTLGTPAPRIGYFDPNLDFETHLTRVLRFASFTPMHNVSGAPAVSLPLGRSGEGLPIGVQAAGAVGTERMLLSLAYELEAARPWPLTPPQAAG